MDGVRFWLGFLALPEQHNIGSGRPAVRRGALTAPGRPGLWPRSSSSVSSARGSATGYGGGLGRKQWVLEHEAGPRLVYEPRNVGPYLGPGARFRRNDRPGRKFMLTRFRRCTIALSQTQCGGDVIASRLPSDACKSNHGPTRLQAGSSFFRKIAIGAIGTRAVVEDLAAHGHQVDELERVDRHQALEGRQMSVCASPPCL